MAKGFNQFTPRAGATLVSARYGRPPPIRQWPATNCAYQPTNAHTKMGAPAGAPILGEGSIVQLIGWICRRKQGYADRRSAPSPHRLSKTVCQQTLTGREPARRSTCASLTKPRRAKDPVKVMDRLLRPPDFARRVAVSEFAGSAFAASPPHVAAQQFAAHRLTERHKQHI